MSTRPRQVVAAGLCLAGAGFVALVGVVPDEVLPDALMLVCAALAAVAGLTFSGRAAWTSATGFALWLAATYLVSDERSIGLAMLTVPGFAAGTVLRLRNETARELAARGTELEAERELFATLAVRNERARIAAELHDVIGHSLSVMVVQAAAGQRLAERDPEAARETLRVIADSVRQGREDLHRLVELLGGEQVERADLSLVDEVVSRAARSGLAVTCRFEGDRDGVSSEAAGVAFRVVREGLTNALRHAPGAAVRVLLRGEGRSLSVRVENDPAPGTPTPGLTGGQGLRGLRERVEELGGRFSAGATDGGGWCVDAALPALLRS